MEPFFQVGVIVEDIEAAMEELARAQGVRWGTVAERQYKQWKFKRVFSMEGPPFIELIEGPPGSPWDSSKGSRIDHLQWWTKDMEADSRRMQAAGAVLDTDGVKESPLVAPDGSEKPGIFRYFRAPRSGMRLELIDESVRADHRKRWGIEKP
jgi:hypothetical protein